MYVCVLFFSQTELKERLLDQFDGDMVLKYQLIPEDLDTLVSVKTDEDLKHMLHEYNRQENQGSPKLRTFLFPSKPPSIAHENQAAYVEPLHHSLEQRYVDAVNGVVRATRRAKITPILTQTPIFSISSACSSPSSNSPELHPVESAAHETLPPCYLGSSSVSSAGPNMHRVQSSPSIYRPQSPQSHRIQQHHYPLHHHHHHAYQSSRPLLDLQMPPGNERMASPPLSTLGRTELRRGLSGRGLDHYYTSFRHHKGCGGFDDFPVHDSCHRIDRSESLPRSPRKKLWE